MSGSTLDWLKMAPAFAVWYPLDIAPTDIVEVNNSGDIVFVGRGFSNGTYTAQVLKLSATGTLLWATELTTEPGTFTQGVYENNSLIVEDDGVIVTMAGRDHLQITKIGNSGNLVYSKQLKVNGATGSDNPGHLFIKNGADGYYAGFECDSSAAIVKLDADMNIIWSKKLALGEAAWLRAMTVDIIGNLMIGGSIETQNETFLASIDPDGVLQLTSAITNENVYSIDQLIQMDDSSVLINGRTSYLVLNPFSGNFHQVIHALPFAAFSKNGNSISFGSHWNNEYILNVDLLSPECFEAELNFDQSVSPFSGTMEDITCSSVNMGGLTGYTPALTDLPGELLTGCDLGVSELATVELTLYPNPVAEGKTLSLALESKDVKNATIFIMDVHGKMVKVQPFEPIIRVSELEPGVYIVRVCSDSKVPFAQQKFIVSE